jgi:glucose-1-phosphate cytidylyltransferase
VIAGRSDLGDVGFVQSPLWEQLMKTVILAGGLGSRLAEETDVKPKPMVEIGGKPILWHIMQLYAHHGVNEFCIALGYRGDYIKHYFANYAKLSSSLTVKLRSGDVLRHNDSPPTDWTVDLVDTGLKTMTGGRIKRMQHIIGNNRFMATYGDGVSDVNVKELLAFHKKHGKLATLTAVRPPARFGHMEFEGDLIQSFSEKPQTEAGWINGGFFVFEPEVFDYIAGDETWLEKDPLEKLAADKQLVAYKHPGFWQCMDTIRDRRFLEEMWNRNEAPWKVY